MWLLWLCRSTSVSLQAWRRVEEMDGDTRCVVHSVQCSFNILVWVVGGVLRIAVVGNIKCYPDSAQARVLSIAVETPHKCDRETGSGLNSPLYRALGIRLSSWRQLDVVPGSSHCGRDIVLIELCAHPVSTTVHLTVSVSVRVILIHRAHKERDDRAALCYGEQY